MPDSVNRYLRELRLLEQLARAQHPQTLSQLAQRLDLPKTSLMRILEALVEEGYVARVPGSLGYMPGPQAMRQALALLETPNFQRAARAILARLVEVVGASCNLTAPYGDSMYYLQRVETRHPLRLSMRVGSHVPLHCTATGKLMLAMMDGTSCRRVLDRIELSAYTHRTLVDRGALEKDLQMIRRQQFGIDHEEFVSGMVALAVPVLDSKQRMIAAVACHGPTARVSMKSLIKQVPKMHQAAAEMCQLFADNTAASTHTTDE